MSNERHDFGRLEFSGGRFEDEGMPVAALNELRRFEVLIEDVALALFRRKNPNKRRIERGFRQSFDLRVSDFKPGSVEAVLTRPMSGVSQLDLLVDDYFTQAYDLVLEEIVNFEKTGSFSHSFPKSAQSRLAALGRGLRASESFGVGSVTGEEQWARLNDSIRNRMSQAAADVPTEAELVVLGRINGLDSTSHKFSFFLSEEQRIVTGRFEDESLWGQLSEFMGYQRRAPLVTLSARVQLSSSGDLESIGDIYAVEQALPDKLERQISKIAGLTDGWYEGRGRAIDEAVLKRVELLATIISASEFYNVLIFPRPDGGVQIEWQDQELELDVLPSGIEVAYAFADERDEDGEREFSSADDNPDRVISWLFEGGRWLSNQNGQLSGQMNI